MKETLIAYETAVLAKEKGFNVAVKYYYTDKTTLDCAYGDIKTYNALSAPTQALLQKWLREKKGISVTPVNDYFRDIGVVFDCWIMDRNGMEYDIELANVMRSPHGDDYYETSYEEALEKGLQYALNLIK